MYGNNPYDNVKRISNRCNRIDVHELQKRELQNQSGRQDYSFQSQQNISTATSTSTSQITSAYFEDIYLYFTSPNKLASDLSSGEIKFSITALNNSLPIENICEIKIGKMYFPRINNSNGAPDYYYYRRVLMQIINLASTQSILGPSSTQFHFEFDVEVLNSTAVLLTPINDTFYFRSPITTIDELQLRFLVPQSSALRRINIPTDTVNIQAIGGTNPGQFKITSGELTTSVLGSIGIPASPGIAVFISGLATPDTIINNTANTSEGIYVTNIINSTTFSISSLDFSLLGDDYSATLYIPKNRIAFTMRFTCVRSKPTNYLTAIHN